MKKFFDNKLDSKKDSKLGTKSNPAKVSVQTEERKKEIIALFKEKGWEVTISLNPDKPEDVEDMELLLNKPEPVSVEKSVGRNDPCSCGSGKKYKKCCGA